MKSLKIAVCMFFLLGLVTFNSYAANQDVKIGYVDLSRLFDEYHKTKDYDKVLEGKHKEFEKSAKEKVAAIQDAQGKLALLTEDEKLSLEGDIEKMKSALLEFDRQEKTNLTKERNEKIREILLEIEKIVSDFAKKEGFSIILNDRVLIFGDEDMNVTESILGILNN